MKQCIPVLTVLALATGSAYAADKKGFDALDRNNDGFVTRSEAAGNHRVLKGFDVADKNNDGKLSRTEYMTSATKRKVRDVVNKPSDPDPGFNALDKNNDGYLTRAEARGNPYLKKFFDRADGNNDGRLNRAEYVAEMAKKDVKTGAAKASTWPDRTAAIQ